MTEIDRLHVALTGDAKDLRGELRSATHDLSGFLHQATQTAAGFTLAMAGIQGFGKLFDVGKDAVIGFNASLEQSRIGWTSMLKSAEAAQGLLLELQQFAAKTPFEFPEVEKNARRLMAMGFAAKDIIPILTDVGNVTAAMGSVGGPVLERITLALGQMQGKAKVSAEEMRQLTEAGIPAWEILADKMGVTIGQTMKLAEEGRISSKVFLDAFSEFSKARFGDMMEKQSHTFLGALSTIKDNLRIMASTAFEPLFRRLSDMADRFAQFTQSDEFGKWGAQVSARVEIVMQVLGSLGQSFSIVFMSILRTVMSVGKDIWEAMQWINPFARHSPSLVESVESGVDRIIAKYAQLSEIEDSLRGVGETMERFRQISAGALEAFQAADLAADAQKVAVFGTDVAMAYSDAVQEVRGLADALPELKRAIDEQEDAVKAARQEVDEHSRSMRDQEAEIRRVEAGGREYRDRMREITQALVPLQDAAAAAKDALADKRLEIERSRDALSLLSESLSKAKDDLNGFMRAPVAGERVFREALGRIEDQITAVQLRIAQAGPRATPAQLKPLRDQLALLQAQREALRLSREQETRPAQRAREAAQLGEAGPERGIEAITQGVMDAAKRVADLTEEEKRARAAQQALERSATPLQEAEREATRAVELMTRQLRDQQNAYRDYMAQVQPLKDDLEEQRLLHAGLVDVYEREREKLDVLKDGYSDVRDLVKDWNDALKETLDSAEKVIQRQKEAEREASRAAKEGALSQTGLSAEERIQVPNLEKLQENLAEQARLQAEELDKIREAWKPFLDWVDLLKEKTQGFKDAGEKIDDLRQDIEKLRPAGDAVDYLHQRLEEFRADPTINALQDLRDALAELETEENVEQIRNLQSALDDLEPKQPLLTMQALNEIAPKTGLAFERLGNVARGLAQVFGGGEGGFNPEMAVINLLRNLRDDLERGAAKIVMVGDAFDKLGTGLRTVEGSMGASWETIKTTFGNSLSWIDEHTGLGWKAVQDKTREIWDAIPDDIKVDLELISAELGRRFDLWKLGWSTTWTEISSGSATILKNLGDGLKAAWDRISTDANDANKKHEEENAASWERVRADVETKLKEIADFFSPLGTFVRQVLDDVGKFGESIVTAIKDGIAKGWDSLKTWFGDRVRETFTGIKLELGIQGTATGSGPMIPITRQSGGPVAAGSSYFVGEHGMELFTPGSNGYVWAANQVNAMMGGLSPQAEQQAVYNALRAIARDLGLDRGDQDKEAPAVNVGGLTLYNSGYMGEGSAEELLRAAFLAAEDLMRTRGY